MNAQPSCSARQTPAGPYLAHSKNDHDAGVAELLRDHLQRVAASGGDFAAAFGCQQQAAAAGWLHDLGKYADQFQRRLVDPREAGRDHWTVGAMTALHLGSLGVLPALAIAGHHAGLDFLCNSDPEARKRLGRQWRDRLLMEGDRFTDPDLKRLLLRFAADGLVPPKIATGLYPTGHAAADMLDVRMLFSALVDADFLETEAHFQGTAAEPRRPRQPSPTLDVVQALAALDDFLRGVRAQHATAPLAAARDVLYQACDDSATRATGAFTLAAPTGTGKTLAMLAFALRHAQVHGLRRVVLVMPFLNIIDQTARIYREIFSPARGFPRDTVVEHHSLAEDGATAAEVDADGTTNRLRLLSENWDAPIILTTTVQFFESLMADRPGRCRKLHRLAQSVMLFDEVQTLPPSLAVATLATLSRLTDPAGPYRCSVVFATATQPAFDTLDARVRSEFAGSGWQPATLVDAATTEQLYASTAGRIRVQWRQHTALDLDELADELQQHPQVLCIVNLKRHAAHLATALRQRSVEGLLHLSTNMCPAHRVAVLSEVGARLAQDQPVRLISTQCVEAGVDLDFPVVYRALGPLEAIAQAAGRCNRHGRRPQGCVVVFKPQDDRRPYPPGYGAAVDATAGFLAALAADGDLAATEILSDPQRLRAYFRQFYQLTGRTAGDQRDEKPLLDAIRAGNFREVADLYRLIGSDTIQVVVPYDRAEFAELRNAAAVLPGAGLEAHRRWRRRAALHAVGLFRPRDAAAIQPYLDPVSFTRRTVDADATWYLALPDLRYDSLLGLAEPAEGMWVV